MEKFPENFVPANYTNEEKVTSDNFRKNVYNTVQKETQRIYDVDICSIDTKIVQKVKQELEALGWEVKVSEFQHLNKVKRSMKIANPLMSYQANLRRDAFGTNQFAPQQRQSAFMRNNKGASARVGTGRKGAF